MKTFIKNILKTAFVALLLTGGASFAAAGTFDNNPANSSTRFVSIASNDSANSANQNDSFSVNIPNYGDTDEFTVFIDFRNEGSGTITNTRGKFNNITNLITNGTITGTLTGNNATNSGLNDQAYLQNLPQDFEIEFVNAYIENTHGTTDPQFCAGYNRNDPVSESQLFGSGANIGDLDDYQNGWCDQGYVVANFRIENTGQAPLNVEIRTNNATNVDENSAVLNGEVEDGNDVDVFFRWSTSSNVSCTNGNFEAAGNNLDAGDDFSETITGLNDDTTYYFIACGEDDNGNDDGGVVRQFTTDDTVIIVPDDIEIRTNNATNVDENSAVLNGEVEDGNDVDVFFRWSTSSNVSCTNGNFEAAGNNLDAGDDFSETITGLNDDTTYYFIACGEDDNGNDDGGVVRQFTTDDDNQGGGNLDVDTDSATNLFQTSGSLGSATLNGEVQDGTSQLAYFVVSASGTPSCFTSAPTYADDFDTPYSNGDEFEYTGTYFLETTYTYRACISADGQVAQGNAVTFRINEDDDPGNGGDDDFFIETRTEQDVTEDSAELRGSVDTTDSDVDNIDLFFVWGEDLSEVEDVTDEDRYDDIDTDGDNLRKRIVEEDFDGDENFEEDVDGLSTDERIYFRFCAEYEDADGDDAIACGEVEDFTTRDDDDDDDEDVEIETDPARNIGQVSADMCGTIDTDGSSVETWIEFRRIDEAGFNRTPSSQRSDASFCTNVGNLRPDTSYRFRACTPFECGVERSFRTQGVNLPPQGTRPFIFTQSPTNIRANSATLNSTYVANAPTASCRFNYGRSEALGRQTRSYTVSGVGSCPHNFTNLASNTRYCVQAEITTQFGTDTGNVTCFTTPRVVTGGPTPTPEPPVIVIEDEDDELDLGLGLSLIRLDIDNNEEVVVRGEEVEYEIEWENISELDLEDLELEVTIPEEIQIVDISRGRLDQDSNTIYFTIDELDGADFDEGILGESGRMTVDGIVGRGTIGNLLTADAEIVYDNPVNDAQENARDFDLDEYGAQVAGVTASVFGLANITFLGWLVILLGLFIIFLVARWLYLEREELRAQAYLTGGYGSNPYAAPRMPVYRDPSPRYDAPPAPQQMPPAAAPRDDYYEPYRPNRG